MIHIAAPALPLHKAGPYVAAAYIVFLLLVIAYVAIIAVRTSRTERRLDELQKDAQAREQEHKSDPDLEHVAAGRLTRAPAGASPEGERGPA
jgi:flagellar biosynthesis/type III secretory pathway M-ring protein FliF/YscJ